eukprot:TRINITY_DN2238_c0_g1_i4.p1 TRINITY_DN2238_c0_g1~~TRINITY_DN2238_c0_g1_i4.p1  ORF type:complete len:124 (-),score=15.27 TRINITY_DN2238_c0_g1_i4:21-392(-)
MFGERLRGGIDIVLPPGEHATYSDLTSYVEDAKSRDVEIQGKVAENIENAQERMKSVYDRKAKTSEIRPGDWVLLKDQVRTNALSPLFTGPWLVAERFGVNLHLKFIGITKGLWNSRMKERAL